MMKYLVLVLLLSGCSLNVKDERVDPVKLGQILQQQSAVIAAITEQIGVLQDKGILERPKPEEAK